MTRSRSLPHPDGPASQRRVVEYLSGAGVLDESQPHIHMTHASVVFVGASRVLKIKRAMQLPFLDYSTLDKRRLACHREVEVNQETAPEIYLGVVPIIERSDGRLAVGGPGTAIEWAVEMRAFDQDDLLSRRVERGDLPAGLIETTAEVVRAMHERAPRISRVDHVAKVRAITTDAVHCLRQVAPEIMFDSIERLAQRAEQAIAIAEPVLRKRAADGFIRRCHGDLHLANIVLWRGRPTPFDAIEFSEEIATVDILYDLAFLIMDLDHGGARDAANLALNRYLLYSTGIDDIAALRCLPLYLGLRAAIRAMVATERGTMLDSGTPGAHAAMQEARSYLSHAVRYLSPAAPRLVAVGGLSGSGKSTLAAALAPTMEPAPGALHLRSDLERKVMLGVAPDERLPEASYTAEMSERVYARLFERAEAALGAGHSVILDAVFLKPEERDAIATLARRHDATFTGLWLDAAPETLRRRVAARSGDASDATPAVVDLQLSRGTGPLAWQRIDASGGPDRTLALVRLE